MRNLISVGTIESKGFKVREKDGIMRIISGALVIMKGIRKRNNVYYFLDSIIFGTAVVAASTDDKKSEATRLWHMHLGHAGKKILEIVDGSRIIERSLGLQIRFLLALY